MRVNKYSLYEQSFVSTITYPNPFNVTFVVSFVSQTGKTFVVNGFYDGNNTWKIRFVPNEVGSWTAITSSTDININNINIQFDCVTSGQHGFLKKDTINPYCMKYENGNYFLPIGDTGNLFIMNQTTKTSPLNWKVYFNEMNTDIKVNHLYTGMITNPLWNNGNYSWAFGGTASSPDFNRYNIEQFKFYDEVIDYAESKNIVISLILLDWITEPKDISNILTTAQKMAFYKYTIARLAHHKNIIWNLYWDISPNQQFVRDEGNFIKSIDPYNHLLTSHQQRDTGYSYATESWTDIISLETLDELNGNDIKNWRIYNKPVIIAEDRYSWWKWADNMSYFFRRLLWASILSGGSATWGDHDSTYSTTTELEANKDSTCYKFGGKKDFKYIYKFFSDINYWEMTPHDELVTTGNKCLAKLGSMYIIYIPNPDSGGFYTYDYGCGGKDHNSVNGNLSNTPTVTINLSSSSKILNVEWYNPRTGTYQGQTTVQGGIQRSFTAPDSNDWVLHIYCPIPLCDFKITIK